MPRRSVHLTQCEMTEQLFNASFNEWQRINAGGWRDWFDPNIPPTDEPTPDPHGLVAKMLEADQTLWYSPGWVKVLWEYLKDVAVRGRLIWVRLKAEWLLSTLPDDPIDPEARSILSRLAEGDFCTVYEGESKPIEGNVEYYLAHLQLNAARRVMEGQRALLGIAIRDRKQFTKQRSPYFDWEDKDR